MKFVVFVCFSVISSVFGELTKFDLEKFVDSLGYELKAHNVKTKDGYLLEIHRVSSGKYASDEDNNRSVLLWHGFLGSSAEFFHLGTGKALPLRLVDEGYDVWVGNNRGNTWGRSHSKLNPDKDSDFWDFSLNELALDDIPSTIDYILDTTKNTQLSFIGHSTGASQFFILASSKPEYNEKVNVMAALAPVVYMNNTNSFLLKLLNKGFYPVILDVEEKLNVTEVLPHLKQIHDALTFLCNFEKTRDLCSEVLFFLTGNDKSEITLENIRKYFKSFPAGTSVKELNHFLQFKITGNFAPYDYGKIENLDIYNSTTPPPYNLSAISVPVGLYYGKNDLIVSITDIDRLVNDLPNVVENHAIEYAQFNHIDFLLANDVDNFANHFIINTLNSYNNKDSIKSTTTSTSTSSPTTHRTSTTTTKAGARGIGSFGFSTVISIVAATLYCQKYM